MTQRISGPYATTYKERLLKLIQSIMKFILPTNPLKMSAEYKKYITSDYPGNHTYKISNQSLQPKYKLASRYKKLRQLFPDRLTSLVDIGCSKGFFVFSAAESADCTRSLGIDVNPYAIDFCQWLNTHLKKTQVSFAKLQLHELAERIEEFGGPFQTVLVVNAYQYLYFGSDGFRDCYLDHDLILQNLRKICSGRVIFNNRIELEDCRNVKCIQEAKSHASDYTERKLIETATKYFRIKHYGKIGKCPLLAFDV